MAVSSNFGSTLESPEEFLKILILRPVKSQSLGVGPMCLYILNKSSDDTRVNLYQFLLLNNAS